MLPRAIFLLAAPMLYAQQYTHLSGSVRDPSDSAVPSATITVVSDDTGFRRTTTTGADGGYVVASLQPGLYKITVRCEGFRTLVRFGVKLDVAQPARVDFTLSLGSMQETITVEGISVLPQGDDASIGTLVGRDSIDRLPLNGRGLLSLMELAPGALVTPATRGESGQFSVNGQRPNANYFTLDGVTVNSGVSGGGSAAITTGGSMPGMTALGSLHNVVPVEALEEFRVQTATTSPEFGRLPGAQVSLSSRAGSNEFRGSLFHYFRHERLDANDWFGNRAGERRAPLRLNDFGASFGGPARRDRTFFFAAWEGLRLRQPFAWRTASPTLEARQTGAPWVRTLLNLFPPPSGPPLGDGLAEWTGRNNRPARLDTFSIRGDHALTSAITVFARYAQSPSFNQFGTTQISELDMRSRSFTMGLNWRLAPRIILDNRWSYSDATAASQWRPADPAAFPPCYVEPVTFFFFRRPGLCDDLVRVTIAGAGQIASGRESLRSQSQWNVLPTIAISTSAHQLRAGLDFRRLSPIRQDRNGSLSILADSIADLADSRNLWLAVAVPQRSASTADEYSAFLQDTWRIHNRLTATLGLRWEYNPAPSFALEQTGDADQSTGFFFDPAVAIWPRRLDNIAPRAGLAFRPTASGRTVLRGGYGIFYNSSLSVAADLVNGGPFALSQYTSGRNGIFSTVLSYGFGPGLRLPLVQQWSASAEHAIGSHDTVSAAYSGATGQRLLRREIGGPGTTESLQIAEATNNGQSVYHAMQLQYRRRMARGLQALVSYSWAHSIDNSSSDALLHRTGAQLHPDRDRAASDFDVRQTLSAAVSYEVPCRRRILGCWSFDSMLRARGAFPITVLNAEHFLGLTYANVFRPHVVPGQQVWTRDAAQPGGRRLNRDAFVAANGQGSLGRNALRGFGMSQWDLALRREFRFGERAALQLRAEAFNLLNHANFADPVRILTSPLFGQSPSMLNLMLGTGSPGSGLTPILQTGGPRSVQLVLRFRF